MNYIEQENGLIHLASYRGQLVILQRLITQGICIAVVLALGCNVNQLGRDGNTALHYACYNNHENCIMYLLSV